MEGVPESITKPSSSVQVLLSTPEKTEERVNTERASRSKTVSTWKWISTTTAMVRLIPMIAHTLSALRASLMVRNPLTLKKSGYLRTITISGHAWTTLHLRNMPTEAVALPIFSFPPMVLRWVVKMVL